VTAVAGVEAPLVGHLEVELVDQHGGAEGRARPAAPQLSPRNPAQVVVEQGHQLIEGGAVAVPECQQQLGDVAGAVRVALPTLWSFFYDKRARRFIPGTDGRPSGGGPRVRPA